jgi:hypothetical protein
MNPWSKTPKRVDYERFLNAHPAISDPRYAKIKSKHKRWGEHLRRNYLAEFNRGYKQWWVKHPERWREAYAETGEESA